MFFSHNYTETLLMLYMFLVFSHHFQWIASLECWWLGILGAKWWCLLCHPMASGASTWDTSISLYRWQLLSVRNFLIQLFKSIVQSSHGWLSECMSVVEITSEVNITWPTGYGIHLGVLAQMLSTLLRTWC